MIVFVHGKIGMGSPPGGSRYWHTDFVKGAQEYFDDFQAPHFTNYDFNFLSKGKERFNRGLKYANENLLNITAGLNAEKDVIRIITHSMGAAFGEGIKKHLASTGYTIETVVHINPFQATDIFLDGHTQTIDYQNTNDPVIFWGIKSRGDIQGATLKIREKSSKNLFFIHRGPIDSGGLFWEDLSIHDTMRKP